MMTEVYTYSPRAKCAYYMPNLANGAKLRSVLDEEPPCTMLPKGPRGVWYCCCAHSVWTITGVRNDLSPHR